MLARGGVDFEGKLAEQLQSGRRVRRDDRGQERGSGRARLSLGQGSRTNRPTDNLEEEIVLALKVLVDCARRDAARLCYRRHRNAAEAVPRKKGQRGMQNPFPSRRTGGNVIVSRHASLAEGRSRFGALGRHLSRLCESG